MPSMSNFCILLILAASFLHISIAAPAAACVVNFSTSTMVVSARTAPSPTTTSSPQELSAPSTTPALPVNAGATQLPAPSGLTLKFVTMGRGIQNYSCNATGANPVPIGAVANLFDFTSLALSDSSALDGITATLVNQPLKVAAGKKLSIDDLGDFPRIGQHFFDAAGTPVFSLAAAGDELFCRKIAAVDAPADAPVGPDGTGAVAWLALVDKGGSQGLSEVYRVVTAGGKPPASCQDTKVISIQYAAEYWFFA